MCFENFAIELTAAGLFRISTGFPFNHFTRRLREPMLGKGTNNNAKSLLILDKNIYLNPSFSPNNHRPIHI